MAQTASMYGEIDVRRTFVAMIYAFVAVESARYTSDLVEAMNGEITPHAIACWSHLILCFVIISTSWVGWSSSDAPGASKPIKSIFQKAYLILALDVWLVVIYYIILSKIEVGYIYVQGHKFSTLTHPSADGEAYWVFGMFATYLIWDVVTKYQNTDSFTNECKEKYQKYMLGKFLLSGGLALITYFIYSTLWMQEQTVDVIVYADAALISCVLAFRGIKVHLPKKPVIEKKTLDPVSVRKSSKLKHRSLVVCAISVLFVVLYFLQFLSRF